MAQGRKETLSTQALQFVDAFLVWVAFWLGSLLRDPVRELLGQQPMGDIGLGPIMPLLFVVIPFTPIALDAFGFYRHPLRKRVGDSLLQMFKTGVVVGVVVGVLVIFLQVPAASRWVLGSAIPFAALFLLGREWLVRSVVLHSVRAEDAKEAVIYVGSMASVEAFEETLPEEVKASYKVVAHFEPSKGTADEFRALLKAESVGRAIFAARHTEFGTLAALVEACELQGVEAWIWAEFIQTQVARPDFDSMGGKPMLVLRSTPELSWAMWVKEVMDRLGALFIILMSSWLWVIAAVGIRLSSRRGPIFFRQNTLTISVSWKASDPRRGAAT